MAERSFAREVQSLRLGAGEEFFGEGILAVTKALLQSGVAYVGGYPGAPISHLMDVLSDARDVLDELGVHLEISANEATAAAMLSASVNYPMRGAVTWKSTVGTNVAADALANLSSAGTIGGALVIVGEDYGEGSSILQERTHAFAMKSQFWLLDPRPNLATIVRSVEQGFELSEASHTPVMLMLRIRACHVQGRFTARDNQAPRFTAQQAREHPQRDFDRIVLPPATYLQERRKVEDRWPAAVRFIEQQGLNEVFPGRRTDIGIVLQGGLYNTAIQALEYSGLADRLGHSDIPLYVLNVTYPLVPQELIAFAAGKRAILVVEEGQPEFLEQAIGQVLRRAQSPTAVVGKEHLPMAGEYTGAVLRDGLRKFLAQYLPTAPTPAAVPALRPPEALQLNVPPRPPGLCTGCPERPFFAAIKLIERELGALQISADIGCHSFATLPPFSLGGSIMGYGLGPASAAAFSSGPGRRPVAILGDGGFWHGGLTSGIANAVFNKHDSVILIIENGYAAATGGQYVPSSQVDIQGRDARHAIQAALHGVGVQWIRTVHTYDIPASIAALREAMTTTVAGPKVIVAQGECQLNRQRRIAPERRRLAAAGARVTRDVYGVDATICTGDRSCIRLSGCPSLTIAPRNDVLRPGVVAHVDRNCVGCGVCGSIAHAAALCPSFYRAEVITNPRPWERLVDRVRSTLIGWLQQRAERRRLRYAIQ
jgi:indolepyruvate ferredoxin oxidoreductase, alpha subunit